MVRSTTQRRVWPRTLPTRGCSPRRRMCGWIPPDCRRCVRVVVCRAHQRSKRARCSAKCSTQSSCVAHVGREVLATRASTKAKLHTATIGQNVPLYSAFRTVRRIRPREVTSFGAFTEPLSSELQSHAVPRRSLTQLNNSCGTTLLSRRDIECARERSGNARLPEGDADGHSVNNS